MFVEGRLKPAGRTILLRLEGFNLFNHGNMLGRAQPTYGDTGTPNAAFGQLVNANTVPHALPGLANIDPPRMFQLQADRGLASPAMRAKISCLSQAEGTFRRPVSP